MTLFISSSLGIISHAKDGLPLTRMMDKLPGILYQQRKKPYRDRYKERSPPHHSGKNLPQKQKVCFCVFFPFFYCFVFAKASKSQQSTLTDDLVSSLLYKPIVGNTRITIFLPTNRYTLAVAGSIFPSNFNPSFSIVKWSLVIYMICYPRLNHAAIYSISIFVLLCLFLC